MPIDPGLGGWAAPVPVDPLLAQERPYIEPISSGEPAQVIQPGQIIPEPVPLVPSVSYSSVARVAQAYHQNLISYNQAYDILVTQFGYSGLDATDALGVELEATVAYQDLTPPVEETVSEPEVTVANGNGNGNGGAPLFEDFQFVGLLAVIGAVYLFKKQG